MVNSAQHGSFIVVEGIDGAGTTTLSRALAKALPHASWTCEPSQGTLGRFLRQALSEAQPGGIQEDAETLALLFAADRREHLRLEIEPALAQGQDIVCDRYLYSSIGYQSFGAAELAQRQAWIRSLQPFARTPDLVLVVATSAEVAAARRKQRAEAATVFETQTRQAWLADYYAALPTHFPLHPIVMLEGDQQPETLLAEAIDALAQRQLAGATAKLLRT